MPRAKPLNFIPSSKNFSEFEFADKEDGDSDSPIDPYLAEEDDLSYLWVEKTILSMLYALPTDRERVILLLQILRSDGYNFDHKSIAELFGVKLRWYLRIVSSIQDKLSSFNI